MTGHDRNLMKISQILLILTAVLCGQKLAAEPLPEAAVTSKRPMLFANYYTWYSTNTGPNQTWTHWVRHPVADEMNKEAKRTGKVAERL